ncbi:hypothetical protein CVU83_00840 [Candidatus Falkowbacteria bacterium HGW-Falkowbacteria-2]|uniref:Uncharacterized protein n=1 Tax=Candidatus Falkowbacteria bacterium HGW-Falkowbacteria-2 TaxID=2013769 RepID=A0A2N2E2L0_9BACT|nr:MAG: hypothetical protein CVU83_00840 [Candidatus Falkowbacteria bacterium HGW-Falkowbacteria-2]
MQVLVGNGYYKMTDGSGDGGYRFAQFRGLPLSGRGGQSAYGLFANVIQVKSKIDDYRYESVQWGLGIAANFILPEGFKQKFAWTDLAYVSRQSRGALKQGLGTYKEKQQDESIYFSAGLLIRSASIDAYDAPFVQQKIMLELQLPFKASKEANWEGKPLNLEPWNHERFKLSLENGIVPIFLDWSRSYYLMPDVRASYIYETGVPRSLFGLGVGFTLSKGEYGYEILSMSYHPLFTQKERRRDVFEVTLNLVSLFRKTY